MFKVIKSNYDEMVNGMPKQTQCGGTVKTVAKAYALMARMRAQQTPGGCNSFRIEQA